MITDISLYHYAFPFVKPIMFGGQTVEQREGCLVKITHDPDLIGWGEIAPLPGFSSESLDEAIAQSASINKELTGNPIPKDIVSLTAAWYPSVRFGYESALLMLGAAAKKVTLAQMINPTAVNPLPLQALLSGSPDEILAKATKRYNAGYRTFKLKVGRGMIDDDLKIISLIRSMYKHEINIRLDANRQFDMETGSKFLIDSDQLNIEYIEEPFMESNSISQYLTNNLERKIALDESLREFPVTQLANEFPLEKIKAFVIKPTMHGYLGSIALVRMALENGIMPSFSSSYESSLGLYLIGVMASTVSDTLPVGLDTVDSLSDDMLSKPLRFDNGSFDIYSHADIVDWIDMSKLTEIPIS